MYSYLIRKLRGNRAAFEARINNQAPTALEAAAANNQKAEACDPFEKYAQVKLDHLPG